MPVNRSAHTRALRFSTLTLCFVLVLAGVPFDRSVKGQNNPNANQDGPRTKGAPGPNLPNLEAARAAGARDEMQPEIKLPLPIAATRCRMRDRICKETKEKKIGLVPSYQKFRGLWASVFDWNAKPSNGFLPEVDALLAAPDVEQLDVASTAHPAVNLGLRRDKSAKPLPRAYASSFSPAAIQGTGNWETARVDEINRTGTGGEDLYSGNYHWSVPLVSLPGRAGHDLNLTLSYNSLVWLKWGNQIRFDHDWSWPSPGFHLGFPTFQGPYLNTQTNLISYQMFTPAGRVVELRQNGSNTYDARDGSLSRLTFNGSGTPVLTTTDGTTYTYGATLDIKDRNGNLITVSYTAFGLYQTITDSLGRVITFNYGAYNDLQTITQTWDNLTKTLVTFSYDNSFQLFPAFSGVTPENVSSGQYVPVIYQLNFLDGTRFNFEYNTYGQITRIVRKGANNNDRAWTKYDLPASGGSPTDCPRFTKRTDWAVDWSPGAGYDTNFCFSDSTCPWTSSHTVGKVTTPDGTTQRTVFATTGWQRGLTTQTETWAGGVKKKWTTLAWENTGTLYQLNPRVYETNIYDDKDGNGTADNRRRTYIEYWDYTYNLPSYVTEYNADATTVLRYSLTNYKYDGQYLNRRLIGLPTERILYDGSNVIQSKVQYFYDETGYLQAHTTQPIRHDSTSNGTAGNYGTNFSYRGNVTSMRRYNVNDNSYVENKTGYYITGNPAYTKNPRDLQNYPQTQTTFSYSGTYLTDGGYPETRPNTYAYPGSITDPDGFTSTIEYHYDRGDMRRTTDPKGAQVRRDYDGMGRMWKVLNETNGAYTRYNFDANHNYVQSYTTIQEGQGEFYSITTIDGHGRTRVNASDHPGSTTNFKGQYTGYDNMGRLYQQSNPAEMNGVTWNTAGDDVAGWAWRYQTYDWQGRPLITTNQDGKTKSVSYDGCGCAGGQVETITDEGTVITVAGQPQTKKRQKKTYYDVLGRVQKTQLLNWENGSPYATTVNTYNVRDQLTAVKEYSGNATGAEACPSTTCQKTDLTYDGHGRLWKQRRPVEIADTVYLYNNDDTLWKMTDPREVNATYTYNNRQLVKTVVYDAMPNAVLPSPLQSRPIPSANVTFDYDAAGNRTAMDDAPGSVSYTYDMLSRLTAETRTFDVGGVTRAFTLQYQYNLAGQLKQITDPWNNAITYNRDKAGQETGLTGTGYKDQNQWTNRTVDPFASNVKYRAWGGIKQFSNGSPIGNGNFAMAYDSRLRLTSFTGAGRTTEHDYYDDGLVKEVRDLHYGSNFLRKYEYDQAARLTKAHAGGTAQTAASPYSLTYGYDEWDHTASRTGSHWSQPLTGFSTNYTDATTNYPNDRDRNMKYDNAGNVKNYASASSDDPYIHYNAAGQLFTQLESSGSGLARVRENYYDGDGVKVTYNRSIGSLVNGSYTQDCLYYYIRSSVLGGAVVAEYKDQTLLPANDPLKYASMSYVYLKGVQLAFQQGAHQTTGDKYVVWAYHSPVVGNYLAQYQLNNNSSQPVNYNYGEMTFDPLGSYVGIAEPIQIEVPAPFTFAMGQSVDGSTRKCYADYVETPCTVVQGMLNSGAGQFAPADNARSAWNPNANNRQGGYELALFQVDWENGFYGFVPTGASYSNGTWSWNSPSGGQRTGPRYAEELEPDGKLRRSLPNTAYINLVAGDPIGGTGSTASTSTGSPNNKVNCGALLASITIKAFKLRKELVKYDPVADGIGGFPHAGGGLTKPGGHYQEIQDLQRGLNNDLQDFVDKCIKNPPPGAPPPPAYPRWINEMANRPVSKPVIPRVPLPIVMPKPEVGPGFWHRLGGALASPIIIIINPCLLDKSFCKSNIDGP